MTEKPDPINTGCRAGARQRARSYALLTAPSYVEDLAHELGNLDAPPRLAVVTGDGIRELPGITDASDKREAAARPAVPATTDEETRESTSPPHLPKKRPLPPRDR